MQFPVTLTDDERVVVKYLKRHDRPQLLTDDGVIASRFNWSTDRATAARIGLRAKGVIHWIVPSKNNGKVSVAGRWELTDDARAIFR